MRQNIKNNITDTKGEKKNKFRVEKDTQSNKKKKKEQRQ